MNFIRYKHGDKRTRTEVITRGDHHMNDSVIHVSERSIVTITERLVVEDGHAVWGPGEWEVASITSAPRWPTRLWRRLFGPRIPRLPQIPQAVLLTRGES